MSKHMKGRFKIPAIVLDHMAGAEIYPESSWYHRNPPAVQARAIEDAQFLLDIQLDGYESYGKAGFKACRTFIDKAKGGN